MLDDLLRERSWNYRRLQNWPLTAKTVDFSGADNKTQGILQLRRMSGLSADQPESDPKRSALQQCQQCDSHRAVSCRALKDGFGPKASVDVSIGSQV